MRYFTLKQSDSMMTMHRDISSEALALICRYEGFSAMPYRCPAGFETVGYGHRLHPDEAYDTGVSQAQAVALLRADVAVAERAVLRLICVPLTDGQFGALVSFTFNLGAGALQRSALRRCVNDARHDDAAAQFGRWVWAGGRKLAGLVARRDAEARLYRGGGAIHNVI